MRKTVLTASAVLLALPLAGCSGNVLELETGDCLDATELEEPEVTEVEVIDCSEEHTGEVYASLEHEDGEFPGADELSREAEERCEEEFASFVGVPYLESELWFSVLTPSKESWEGAEDRTSLCILTLDEPVTGSLEGSER